MYRAEQQELPPLPDEQQVLEDDGVADILHPYDRVRANRNAETTTLQLEYYSVEGDGTTFSRIYQDGQDEPFMPDPTFIKVDTLFFLSAQ